MDPMTEINRHAKVVQNIHNKVDAYLSNEPQPDVKAGGPTGLEDGNIQQK